MCPSDNLNASPLEQTIKGILRDATNATDNFGGIIRARQGLVNAKIDTTDASIMVDTQAKRARVVLPQGGLHGEAIEVEYDIHVDK